MAKIEVNILKSDYYAKLANYDEINKANNKIIVANATKIKNNMERKEKLVSNVTGPMNRLNKDDNKFQNKDKETYDMFGSNVENDL